MIDKRRNVKWTTSMMLLEHVELLRQYREEQKLVEKPYIDEYVAVELQEDLERAYLIKSDVTVRTWIEGKIRHYRGEIKEVDISKKSIALEDPFKIHDIKVEDIVYVQINN